MLDSKCFTYNIGRFQLFLLNIGICGANDFANDFFDHILNCEFHENWTNNQWCHPKSSNYFILIRFLPGEFSLYTYFLEDTAKCFSENNTSFL